MHAESHLWMGGTTYTGWTALVHHIVHVIVHALVMLPSQLQSHAASNIG